MAARRIAAPPPISYLARSSLPATTYPDVDAVLKQLKTCTRRLQTALSSHRLELQVLERLYYKGKNQHRAALFWRRVVEMRRYGDRLEDMDMGNLTESLRLAFWGDPPLRNPKALKGSWTNCPDAKYVTFVLKRCSECCQLVEKARERLSAAYHSFTLLMQTAAFLQLTLTLVAIASRLSMLLTEVHATSVLCQTACYQLLLTIDPEQACKVQNLTKDVQSTITINTVTVVDVNPSQKAQPSSIPDDAVDEDLGSILARPESSAVAEASIAGNEVSSSFSLVPSIMDVPLENATTTFTERPMRTTVSRKASTTVQKRDRSEGQQKGKSSKKQKRKRDEIDDIFGF